MQYYFDYILLPYIENEGTNMHIQFFFFMSHLFNAEPVFVCFFCLLFFCCHPVTDLQYSADAEKVSFLLKAPLYFDLEMYSSAPRLEKVGV